MRDVTMPIPLALLVVAVVVCGCTRHPSPPRDRGSSDETAPPQRALTWNSELAVTRSNEEARRLYEAEPFTVEHGHWRSEGQQQIWQALTSSGGRDFTAKVTFDEKGGVANVEVQMLGHPSSEPSTNVPPVLEPDMKPEKNLGIPEVMPK